MIGGPGRKRRPGVPHRHGAFHRVLLTRGILRHNLAGGTDTTALDAIEQAIEPMRSGPALAEPDPFITSPSSWSALRRFKDDLHESALWQREDQPEPIGCEEAIWLAPDLAEQVRDMMADLGRRPADVLN